MNKAQGNSGPRQIGSNFQGKLEIQKKYKKSTVGKQDKASRKQSKKPKDETNVHEHMQKINQMLDVMAKSRNKSVSDKFDLIISANSHSENRDVIKSGSISRRSHLRDSHRKYKFERSLRHEDSHNSKSQYEKSSKQLTKFFNKEPTQTKCFKERSGTPPCGMCFMRTLA